MITKIQKVDLARDYAVAIVETVREPLVILNSELRVLTANRSFYKLFQVNKKATEQKLIYDLGNGQWNNPKLRFLLNKIIPKKSFFQDYEIEHEFPQIGKRVVLLNGRKIVQKNPHEPLILLAIEDITEKKKLDLQKDDFIAIASHELKTPVTSIKAYAQILQRNPLITNDKKASKMLANMDMQMNRLSELVASFMNVYKLGSGKLKLKKELFSLDILIKEVIKNYKFTVLTHIIEYENDKKVNVVADKERIHQVLINLISNAIKYSPKANKVKVGINKDTAQVTVSIKDFGIGIPKDEQHNIYERFFRAKGLKESKIQGLGLGLFISTEIVKQHGGELWVDSMVGKGSTFYFTLPTKP